MKFLILCVFLYSSVSSAKAQIDVDGDCSKKVEADQVEIVFNSVETNMSVDVAVQKMNVKYNKLVKDIKKLTLKDLQLESTNYSVRELSEWENNKSVFKGYQASLGLRVVTKDLKQLPKVLKVAQNNKIPSVGGFSYMLSKEKSKEVRNSCYALATKDAKEKAELLAKGLGLSIGEVIKVSSTESREYPNRPVMHAMKTMESSFVNLEVSEQEVSVKVSVTFSLKEIE